MAKKPEPLVTVPYVAPQNPAGPVTDADLAAALATADAEQAPVTVTPGAAEKMAEPVILTPSEFFRFERFELEASPTVWPDRKNPAKTRTQIGHVVLTLAPIGATVLANINRILTPVSDATGSFLDEEFRVTIFTRGYNDAIVPNDPAWSAAYERFKLDLAEKAREWYDAAKTKPAGSVAGESGKPKLIRRIAAPVPVAPPAPAPRTPPPANT